MTVATAPLRVVQWATGNVGTHSLREVIRHPSLELVGLRVYDPEKEGVDAGTLCGEGPTGVAATTDRSAIVALAADCALYMPRALDLDDVVALLEAGTNVVTTCGELGDGGRPLGDEGQARVLDACARCGTSVYATGSSPGFITGALSMALLLLQRRVDSIAIEEFANLSQRDSPNLLFEQMGFGRSPDSFTANRSAHLQAAFGPALGELAAAAGRPVDAWTSSGEVATARETTQLAAGELPAGTIAAQRTAIIGHNGGTEIVRMTPTWYCTTDIEPEWDLRPTGWRVRVRGDAPFDVELAFTTPLEEMGPVTPGYTANPSVNAVPYVCAAEPGILSATDMPPITPAGPNTEH